jgi:hypothetical protein
MNCWLISACSPVLPEPLSFSGRLRRCVRHVCGHRSVIGSSTAASRALGCYCCCQHQYGCCLCNELGCGGLLAAAVACRAASSTVRGLSRHYQCPTAAGSQRLHWHRQGPLCTVCWVMHAGGALLSQHCDSPSTVGGGVAAASSALRVCVISSQCGQVQPLDVPETSEVLMRVGSLTLDGSRGGCSLGSCSVDMRSVPSGQAIMNRANGHWREAQAG